MLFLAIRKSHDGSPLHKRCVGVIFRLIKPIFVLYNAFTET